MHSPHLLPREGDFSLVLCDMSVCVMCCGVHGTCTKILELQTDLLCAVFFFLTPGAHHLKA